MPRPPCAICGAALHGRGAGRCGGAARARPREAELRATVEATRAAWMPRVMFVLVPLFAWFVSLARRSSGRGYPAHMVLALHLHAAWFGVRGLATASGLVLPDLVSRGLDLLAAAYGLMYLFVSPRVVSGVARGRAARDLVLIVVPYAVGLVLATAGIVALAIFGDSAWARCGSPGWRFAAGMV